MRLNVQYISSVFSAVLILAAISFGQAGWVAQNSTSKVDLVAVHFISEKRGFVAGDDGVLLSTDDGGETWTKYPLNTTENINEIYFRNDKDGYIVAGRLIFTTSDGGRTWQESRILSEADFKNGTPEFISIRFSDKKRGLAIGSLINKRDEIIDSIVMRTTDGGASWQRVIIPTKSELFHLDFNGNSHGWIVGDKGLIIATTDGGDTWTTQRSGVTRALFAVDFRDDNNGFAVGGGGTIIRTNDGGVTWQKVITPFKDTLKRVNFTDDKNGWAVGHRGTILKTMDKGLSWGKQPSPVAKDFYGMFVGKKYGCAVGEGGVVATFQK